MEFKYKGWPTIQPCMRCGIISQAIISTGHIIIVSTLSIPSTNLVISIACKPPCVQYAGVLVVLMQKHFIDQQDMHNDNYDIDSLQLHGKTSTLLMMHHV